MKVLYVLLILLALLLPFPLSQGIQADESTLISFAVFSDTHICSYYPDYQVKLSQVVDKINTKEPEFSIGLGDMIGGGSTEAVYNSEWSNMSSELDGLDMPYYLVMGNHESVSGWTREQNINKWLSVTGYEYENYSFDNGDFHFIVLDTVSANQTGRDWLADDLDATEKLTVVFTHRPVADVGGQAWEAWDSSIKTILESYSEKIVAVFNGHLHENVDDEINGIKYYTIPEVYYNATWSLVTVYSTGEIEIRGYGNGKSYLPESSAYLDIFFSYSSDIEIDNFAVSENRIDYPLKVHLTSSNFNFNNVQSDGDDIRFSSGDTVLPHEIDYWTNGDAVVWVKVPYLTAGEIDTIQMYYGSTAGNAENPRNVWGQETLINYFTGTSNITGTNLSSMPSNGYVGVYGVRDTIDSPAVGTTYVTEYSGTWDFSAEGLELIWWLKCNRDSTAFTSTRLYVYDASGNYRYKNISFTANTPKKAVWTIANGTASATPPDLSAITKITWEIKAADTTAFNKNLDLCYVYKGYNVVLHFNESSGNELHNSTIMGDYAAPGTVYNGTWDTSALIFNGSSTYAEFLYSDEFNCYEQGYTVDGWVSSQSTSNVKVIADYGELYTTPIPMRLHLLNMAARIITYDGTINSQATAGTLSVNTMAYVAATFNSSYVIAYKDGVSSSPTARTAVVPSFVGKLNIGRTPSSANYWNGKIDEFRWINVPRSNDYIAGEYINLKGVFQKDYVSID